MTYQFIATTQQGLEEVLCQELQAIGATDLQPHLRAVAFRGDQAVLYKANLWLRTAMRLLIPIAEFSAQHPSELYEKALNKVDWTAYLQLHQTFAINAAVNSEFFSHSQFAALRLKDAICDQFRQKHEMRPSVDVRHPDIAFQLHIRGDKCTLLLDASGEPLYKRGYREEQNLAPLNEGLAAGMLLLSGWKGDSHFVDPMCGSGTILIEAAMIATNTAPGLRRRVFTCMNWRDFNRKLWQEIVAEAKAAFRPAEYRIVGCDIDRHTAAIAADNATRAGIGRYIEVRHQPMQEFTPPRGRCMVMTNPPYGERLTLPDLNALYTDLGDMLKQRFSEGEAWILSSNPEAMKHVGLRHNRRITLVNGALLCKLQRYELYEGTKKNKLPR